MFQQIMLLSQAQEKSNVDAEEVKGLFSDTDYHLQGENSTHHFNSHHPYIFLWKRTSSYLHVVALYIANLVLLITLICTLAFPQSCSDLSQELYSPAEEAIEYKEMLYLYDHEEFNTLPDDKQDNLWSNLYNFGLSLAINSSSATKLLNQTMKLPGSSESYVIGLEVFHQLHCVDQLRQSIYPDRYNKSYILNDGSKNENMRRHLEHCIDVLRFAVMCHSDITPLPYTWDKRLGRSVQSFQTLHTCRNFKGITDWAVERHVKWAYGKGLSSGLVKASEAV